MTLKTREEIELWLISMNIKNYTINEDFTVDVQGKVDLSKKKLREIPIQFNKVKEFFDCSDNLLTSLKGSPRYVGQNFNCFNNLLTNLEGAPYEIGNSLRASNNELNSTKGISKQIGQFCDLSQNPITHIDYYPEDIAGEFYFCDTKGMLEDFKDLYKTDSFDPYNNCLSLGLVQMRATYLHKKLDNKLNSSKIINKPKGKI